MRPPCTLAEFLDSVQLGLDEARRATQALPDVVDVVARARALAPNAVPAEWLARAKALPVAEAPATTPAVEGGLGFFLGEVRRQLDDQVRAGVTERRGGRSGRGRLQHWLVAAIAIAAVAVASLGIAHYVAEPVSLDARPSAAEQLSATRPDEGTPVLPRAIEPAPRVPAELPDTTAPLPSNPATPPKLQRPARLPPAPLHGEASLEALEREAQRLWAAGDLAGARDRFERIASKGGRTEIAELALGDLISLAMRSRDRTRLRMAWARYVQRFPRGRYADDARAGLCRTNAAVDRPACWREYLADFASGAHRSEARSAIETP